MSTISNARRRVKPERRLRLLQAPGADGGTGLLRIAVGREVFLHSVRRLTADFGSAFALTKLVMRQPEPSVWEPAAAERYEVLLADDGRDQCPCEGASKFGRCKHTAGLCKLRELGLI